MLQDEINYLVFPSHLFPSDCESHCKASKGKMKITMKKYCKKDYGEWVQYAGMCAARRQPAVKRSDVSINQMPSTANPHPSAALRVSVDSLLTQPQVMSTNTD